MFAGPRTDWIQVLTCSIRSHHEYNIIARRWRFEYYSKHCITRLQGMYDQDCT